MYKLGFTWVGNGGKKGKESNWRLYMVGENASKDKWWQCGGITVLDIEMLMRV